MMVLVALWLVGGLMANGVSEETVRCVRVIDGDTLVVLHAAVEETIVLAEVDAPESEQDCGEEARQMLANMVLGRELRIVLLAPDARGQKRARVEIGALDVGLEMVRAGMAWHDATASDDSALAAAQIQARVSRLGLWLAVGPVPPWEFRRGTRSLADLARTVKLRGHSIRDLPPGSNTGDAPNRDPRTAGRDSHADSSHRSGAGRSSEGSPVHAIRVVFGRSTRIRAEVGVRRADRRERVLHLRHGRDYRRF
jgi:micrococcal nuclease